ncbi:alpha/beta hydrolase [Pseudomonas parafulva]|uniref:alpha/beta hydrolase n=1 Tax=Pseudomonas parafulva TaxID=157782 RepID=UPI003561BCC6
MSLHPDLAGFLELAELGRLTGASQPMHQMSVEQARAEFERSSQVLDPSPPDDLQVEHLQMVDGNGQPLPARLYRRQSPLDGLQPVLLYFHGGGYVVGSLDSHDAVCRRLAMCSDFAVLAPAYRLAPEAPFPAAADDALASARWLVEHGEAQRLDARRVVVSGDSAGASLAIVVAAVAAQQPEKAALRPLAQLLFYPVTDISCQRPSHGKFAEGYLLESETLEWFYRHYVRDASQRLDWRVSPLHLTALEGLAPTWMALAGHDPLLDEGVAWAHALEKAGVPLQWRVEEALTHDFLRMQGMVEAVEGIYAEVGRWLKAVGAGCQSNGNI